MRSNQVWSARRKGPIVIDEEAADAFLRTLNIVIRDPDKAEPSYALYLELRRFLGRLYS